MVKQNLPVGAVFEDGGLYFEVQSVLPDGNYISKRIEKQEPVNEEAPVKSEDEVPLISAYCVCDLEFCLLYY